jgi:hypothetical protein
LLKAGFGPRFGGNNNYQATIEGLVADAFGKGDRKATLVGRVRNGLRTDRKRQY